MLHPFRKAFWVPYEDSTTYPTIPKAKEAIARYCVENGYPYAFPTENTVQIDGRLYEIYRGYQTGSRGNYGIKCTET